jgi:hypothetical protein
MSCLALDAEARAAFAAMPAGERFGKIVREF